MIDYVVNKYGGAGIESFLTIIDENNTEAISLFKEACGFRSCSLIEVMQKEGVKPTEKYSKNNMLKEAKITDAKEIQELDTQNLFPQFRPSLNKHVSDFKFGFRNALLNKAKGFKIKRMVLKNNDNKSIEGYLSIADSDNKNFWIDITLSLPYVEYFEDVLEYAKHHAHQTCPNHQIFIFL